MLGQDGDTSIHEFQVYPVDQQGSLAQLNERTETPISVLPDNPAAPGVTRRQNHEQHAHTDQEKTWAGVPVIVDGIKLMRLGIDPARSCDEDQASRGHQKENLALAFARPLALQDKSASQSGEGEGSPRKNWEHPGLRRAQILDAVNVGLDWPG